MNFITESVNLFSILQVQHIHSEIYARLYKDLFDGLFMKEIFKSNYEKFSII